MIRSATLDDLDQLEQLEQMCFTTDRLSRRQLRYLLTKGKASLLVEVEGNEPGLLGYVAVLYSKATSMARLYSIAVRPDLQGRGVGRRLLEAAEEAAWEHQRAYMRAEVRKDNTASLALFDRLGYRRIGEWQDYYEDHMDAWRLEKRLHPDVSPQLSEIPYYQQTLDFTCGPAALMMAMHALDDSVPMDRTFELRLWREATTIFMTSGHGGCGPYGLALAAANRGFDVFAGAKKRAPAGVQRLGIEWLWRSVYDRSRAKLILRSFLSFFGILLTEIYRQRLSKNRTEYTC